jgi:hypothetical protein
MECESSNLYFQQEPQHASSQIAHQTENSQMQAAELFPDTFAPQEVKNSTVLPARLPRSKAIRKNKANPKDRTGNSPKSESLDDPIANDTHKLTQPK